MRFVAARQGCGAKGPAAEVRRATAPLHPDTIASRPQVVIPTQPKHGGIATGRPRPNGPPPVGTRATELRLARRAASRPPAPPSAAGVPRASPTSLRRRRRAAPSISLRARAASCCPPPPARSPPAAAVYATVAPRMWSGLPWRILPSQPSRTKGPFSDTHPKEEASRQTQLGVGRDVSLGAAVTQNPRRLARPPLPRKRSPPMAWSRSGRGEKRGWWVRSIDIALNVPRLQRALLHQRPLPRCRARRLQRLRATSRSRAPRRQCRHPHQQPDGLLGQHYHVGGAPLAAGAWQAHHGRRRVRLC